MPGETAGASEKWKRRLLALVQRERERCGVLQGTARGGHSDCRCHGCSRYRAGKRRTTAAVQQAQARYADSQ